MALRTQQPSCSLIIKLDSPPRVNTGLWVGLRARRVLRANNVLSRVSGLIDSDRHDLIDSGRHDFTPSFLVRSERNRRFCGKSCVFRPISKEQFARYLQDPRARELNVGNFWCGFGTVLAQELQLKFVAFAMRACTRDSFSRHRVNVANFTQMLSGARRTRLTHLELILPFESLNPKLKSPEAFFIKAATQRPGCLRGLAH